jgi:hypothetical protein
MIRGILPTSRGYDTNGQIVLATQQADFIEYKVWYITPHLHSKHGIFRGALEENLFPLQNPRDDEVDLNQKSLITHD